MRLLLRKYKRKLPLYYPLHNFFKKKKHKAELVEWETRGRPLPPPHLVKQRTLIEYANRFDLKILVETGTFYGDMVEAMKNTFDQIYSIELSGDLHEIVKYRFKGLKNIHLIQGDSGVEIANILEKIDKPTLFWLDGHYSSGITAKGEKETPIFEELKHVLARTDIKKVLVIDDARCFGVDKDYPSIEELKEYIKGKWPESSFQIKNDSIIIA